jgi:serine protease
VSRLAALLVAVLAAFLSSASAGSVSHGAATARAAGLAIPNDTGGTRVAGGWAQVQWNFTGPYGVNAPGAWANLERDGAPGGSGVTVAVLDTGVAYANRGVFRRSPDLAAATFVPGYDFVSNDPYPLDLHGHGTHVASTIAEQTNNGFGLTGLAYGATIMPVRILDAAGNGSSTTVAAGIRFAVDNGAKIINLSFNFEQAVDTPQIPNVVSAVAYAHEHDALVVAAVGNDGRSTLANPARMDHVVAVGATTEHGCLSAFSNSGPGVDLVAPGGGRDTGIRGDPNCAARRPGRPVYQITTAVRTVSRFEISGRFAGTSMATSHVSAAAALIVASGVLGPNPSPEAIERRLTQTARDLGPAGYDTRFGWGLLDAAAATSPIPDGR